MSSTRQPYDEQAALPFEVAPTRPDRGPARAVPEERLLRHRLDAAACGWPVGTEVLVERGRRPRRGDVVLAREGGATFVGPFEMRFGRPFLRGSGRAIWLGPGVDLVGVVVAVDPSLALNAH